MKSEIWIISIKQHSKKMNPNTKQLFWPICGKITRGQNYTNSALRSSHMIMSAILLKTAKSTCIIQKSQVPNLSCE